MSGNKTRKCPPYHLKNAKTGKCELLKIYQLRTKPNTDNIKLMAQGMRDLMPDELFESEYIKNKNGFIVEIIKGKNVTKKNHNDVSRTKTIVTIPSQEDESSGHEFDVNEIDYYIDNLYPRREDKFHGEFNIKVASHKEFRENQYDGTIHDIKDKSDELCKSDFELMPHQNFIKNFLSFNTPYNSLLLFHGLGTGKTCSAIGVSEEMRQYMKQTGITKSIYLIASPNVQDNFRSQLFDESKLEQHNGLWSINNCAGSGLLNEINPSSIKNMKKERVVSQVNSLINQYYNFMGYTQFGNFIERITDVTKVDISKRNKIKSQKIKKAFENKIIIIDEVHNIRITEDNKYKKIAEMLMEICKYTENLHILFLSATPMFDSYEEIIWLTNIMNINDKRSTITVKDVFSKKGEFVNSNEKGEELLRRKLTGYVSYVRSENPYTFPVRIYARNDDWNKSEDIQYNHPKFQMNGKEIQYPMEQLHNFLFYNSIGEYQRHVYDLFIKNFYDKDMQDINESISKGYSLLQKPILALNITYPHLDYDVYGKSSISEKALSTMIGESGLERIMKTTGKHFEYRADSLKKFGRIFSQGELHKYSAKLDQICKIIDKSEGISIIYSQYIDGGAIPMALALEEMGFLRYSSDKSTNDSLLKDDKKQVPNGNYYSIITGDPKYSQNNDADIKYINRPDNKNGKNVKVVLISKAAAEGVDFKNIRQIHVLEPWYNLNRIEQIIGRGVRNLGHCALPFEKRNVEIFLHGTILNDEQEATDMYIYRLAEQKSIKIGRVTRLLKETSIDCLLNIGQTNFTPAELSKLANNKNIECRLPNGTIRNITYGDQSFTAICDYMENCEFSCSPSTTLSKIPSHSTTLNDTFITFNNDKIMSRIRDLFKDIPKGKHFYKKDELFNAINISKRYNDEQIYSSLQTLIKNSNQYITDKYGRMGRLVNNGEFYLFQPIEITDEKASIYERSVPIDIKLPNVRIDIDNVKSDIAQSIDIDKVIKEMKSKLEVVSSKDVVKNGESNWFKNCSAVATHLKSHYDIDIKLLSDFVIHHMIDELDFNIKKELLEYIYKLENLDSFVETVKQYFDNFLIKSADKKMTAIVLAKDNTESTIFVNNNNEWKQAEYTDLTKLKSAEKKEKYPVNHVFGFISWIDDSFSFKIRDVNEKRNTKGARMSQASANTVVRIINRIIGDTSYSMESVTDNEKGKSMIKFVKDNTLYSKNKMVVILELILRHYENIHKDKKSWILTNENILGH